MCILGKLTDKLRLKTYETDFQQIQTYETDLQQIQTYETDLQQIQGITYYSIQALYNRALTDNCQMAVEHTGISLRLNALTLVMFLSGVWTT